MSTEVVMVRLLVMRSDGLERVGRDAGSLLLDLEDHAVAFVDLRRDLEGHAHLFALNRLERIDAWNRAARVGVLAGDERHFLRRP